MMYCFVDTVIIIISNFVELYFLKLQWNLIFKLRKKWVCGLYLVLRITCELKRGGIALLAPLGMMNI